MLTDIVGWNDHLGLRHIVVLQEDDLKCIADILVIVDNVTDTVDEMDNCLCHPVSWCSLSTEDRYTWCQLLALLWSH